MAGTSLFTHTTFDMLQNHSRYSGVLSQCSVALANVHCTAAKICQLFFFLPCKLIQWWSRVTLKTTKLHSMRGGAFCSAALRLWKTLSDPLRAPQTGDSLKRSLKTSHSLFFFYTYCVFLFVFTRGLCLPVALWDFLNVRCIVNKMCYCYSNFCRITAAVEKVALLWQQAFAKARLQLQAFQLREDALQVSQWVFSTILHQYTSTACLGFMIVAARESLSPQLHSQMFVKHLFYK